MLVSNIIYMSRYSGSSIKQIDNIELSQSILKNVDRITNVKTKKLVSVNNFIITVYVEINDYSKLKSVGDIYSIIFYDFIGFGKTFMQLFDEFIIHTNLTKCDISNYLRKYVMGVSITPTQIAFNITVQRSNVL